MYASDDAGEGWTRAGQVQGQPEAVAGIHADDGHALVWIAVNVGPREGDLPWKIVLWRAVLLLVAGLVLQIRHHQVSVILPTCGLLFLVCEGFVARHLCALATVGWLSLTIYVAHLAVLAALVRPNRTTCTRGC